MGTGIFTYVCSRTYRVPTSRPREVVHSCSSPLRSYSLSPPSTTPSTSEFRLMSSPLTPREVVVRTRFKRGPLPHVFSRLPGEGSWVYFLFRSFPPFTLDSTSDTTDCSRGRTPTFLSKWVDNPSNRLLSRIDSGGSSY